ncbi:RlpA-like double-psi beta-barrel domain protein [Kalmanozyma brasiliensis GHG001]|uniref:RlpA-like protein double-psi beta-barrel domain-containing protein n=1 Tax=Kalmanozyma brasiliensis (strain GHG001) TaxID=1365824 RepID=V5EVS5_KALBG|nr:RlpA-like double-psi beta-barrel domain protein [Kalmanozyma brasiliensis GHG001]EST06369.1 RlpA-like double-psi beta-barrel domain protein [Kalmanozyma brasiliensis GHG001]
MKFTTAVLTLLSAAVAVSAAAIDTNESGLSVLGERSFERKARHVEMAARSTSTDEENEKRDFVAKNGKVTWYGGGQLNNPACGGPTPNDNSYIAAVKKNGGYGSCGDTVHLHYNGKMVSVKIVDYCESCEWGHFDITRGSFRKLANLNQGVLNNVHFKLINKK